VTWLNRGTLHLVRSEDYPLLHALLAPRLVAGNTRRLRQEGVSGEQADRGVRVLRRALADGPVTRAADRELLDAAGVPTAGQGLVHVLRLACLQGHAVRGPVSGSDQAYVGVEGWLGPQPPVDREVALGELGRRYLAGHGPADQDDLARWTGLGRRDAARALAAAAPRAKPSPPAALPPPRLLGGWEPVLLGWASRADLLGEDSGKVTVEGVFKPFALVGGRAVATWRLDGKRPVVDPFRPVPPDAAAALQADGADVMRFLGRA
jgi:hypothetical protein